MKITLLTILSLWLITTKSFGAEFNNDKPAILFIHGLGGKHTIWEELINNLPDHRFSYVGNLEYSNNGTDFTRHAEYEALFPCFTMDFSENQNMSFNAQAYEIKKIIEKIEHLTKRKKVILFAHSMGGLAARAYINNYGNEKIGGLVTVGTPHLGSYLGEMKHYIEDENSDAVGKSLMTALNSAYSKIDIQSNAVGFLSPCSDEIQKINSFTLPNDLIITSVISNWEINENDDVFKLWNTILFRLINISPDLANLVNLDIERKKQLILKLLQKNMEKYALLKDCNTALKICTPDRLEELGDGVVPLISQDITYALPNQNLNVTKFYSNRFHVDIPKDIPKMQKALLNSVYAFLENCDKPNKKKAIAFILDSSGSMKRNDRQNRRISTVSQLFDFLDNDNNIYLIDFDDDAKWINPDNYRDWEIESLRNSLLTVDSEGGTNIGKALSSLKNVLTSTLGNSYFGGAILLTDGKGDYNNEADWFQENNIPIYTVSFTNAADVNLLNTISDLTGGQFIMANNENDVINALEFFFNTINCYSVFASESLTIKQSEKRKFDFSVDPETNILLGSLSWIHSKIQVKLFEPNGNEIKSSELINNGQNYLTFKIPKPKKGIWSIEVDGQQVPKHGDRLNLKVSGDTYYNLSIKPVFDSTTGIISLNISDNAGILERAEIQSELTITFANGKPIIFDNPFKNGNFSYRPHNGPGVYNFNIDLSLSYRNTTISRQYFKSVQVGKNNGSYNGFITGKIGSVCSTTIGKNSGNSVGIKCFIYTDKGKRKARGFVQSVNQTSSKVKIIEYFSGNKVKVGDLIRLDKEQWLNDNTR